MKDQKKIKRLSKKQEEKQGTGREPTIMQEAEIKEEKKEPGEGLDTLSSASTSPITPAPEIKSQNLYVKMIILLMVLVLLAVGGVAWYRYASNTFEYVGLDFQREMFDKLLLYHAKIPITSPTGNVIANFNFYLRNDPRTLEEIPIQGRIALKKEAIIALDSSMEDCSDNSIAGVNLGQFLAAAGVKALPGSTDQTQAEEQGLYYASCDAPVPVIITEKAEKTQILQEGSCYKIQVAECNDVVKATERFMLGAIGHSSGYDI